MNTLTHFFRGTHPRLIRPVADIYFHSVLTAFGQRLGVTFTATQVRWLQLPLDSGGLGLPNYDVSLAAYLLLAFSFSATSKIATCLYMLLLHGLNQNCTLSYMNGLPLLTRVALNYIRIRHGSSL